MKPADMSAVTQDYLKTIWLIAEWSDDPVTTKLLSERLGVTASTVSDTIRKLAEQGLVNHQPYSPITLTSLGRAIGMQMVRRHRLIETYLVTELGYGWDEVQEEAEVLEHAVSDLFITRLDAHLGYPDRDPHGDPIPNAEGHMPEDHAVALWQLQPGDTGTIVRIGDQDGELLRYFTEIGLTPGAKVWVMDSKEFLGVMTICIGFQDSDYLDLGEVAASHVWINHDKK